MDPIQSFKPHLECVAKYLLESISPGLPASLKEPILYFLEMPGKKIRPLLALFSSQVVGGTPDDAIPAAIAVELFHDFTLIHDDIMDHDELRRGLQTMHVKYGFSTAILVGDALIGMAYQQLLKSPPHALEPAVKIFTEALVKVCEGQALDKEFEARDSVTVEEYLDMIGKKTAWLLKIACSIGGISGGATDKQVSLLSQYGYCLGLGFQIQDDLLDFVADETKLGKKIGSDFRLDKKTYVALKYREIVSKKPDLKDQYPLYATEYSSFSAFQKALGELGIVEEVQNASDNYFQEALEALEQISPLNDENPLYMITRFLQNREY